LARIRSVRMNALGVVLSICAALTACSSPNQPAPGRTNGAELSIRQPSTAELARFLPGGVPATGIPLQAPLPCGGVAKSVRRAMTAIRVPDSLLALSVSEYEFASGSGVNAYVDAIKTLPKASRTGHYCDLAVANSGDFYPGSGAYLTNDGYYLLAAATQYGRGIYNGSYSYTSIAYVTHRDIVFVVRVDRQSGYPDEAFMGVLLRAFELPGGPKLNTGNHSATPTSVTAIIHPADYDDGVGGANPAVTNSLCPQAIVSGTPYNITFERQLPHPTPAGLVIPGTTAGTSTTVRWGSTVTLVVDTFGKTENEPYSPCRNGTVTDENYVDILSIRSAN
jgi:hypothetical protein